MLRFAGRKRGEAKIKSNEETSNAAEPTNVTKEELHG